MSLALAYLNTAHTKLDAMRKEAGKITNTEIQSSITQIFYYLCVVAIQLVAPVALIAGMLMMARSFTSECLLHGIYFASNVVMLLSELTSVDAQTSDSLHAETLMCGNRNFRDKYRHLQCPESSISL